MTSSKTTPPASKTPAAETAAAPAPASASGTAATSESSPHWTKGALNGAGRLLSTAANDDLVRGLISSRAKSNLAAGLFGGTLMGAIAARIATRSVPGALLVGGALVAKAVYDHRKSKDEPTKS